MSAHNSTTFDDELHEFKDNIDVITIDDDEEEEDNDNDIQIIEVKYSSNTSFCKKPTIVEMYQNIVSKEITKAETFAGNSSTNLLSNESNQLSDKCPKRITPTKVESIASTSVSTNSETINGSIDSEMSEMNDSKGVTPNKVQRVIGPKTQKTVAEKEVDVKQLYENYLIVFRDRMKAFKDLKDNESKAQELISKLIEMVSRIRRERIQFSISRQFAKLFKVFAEDIGNEKDDNRVIRHHNDLLLELNRVLKSPNMSPNKPKLSKDVKEKRIQKLTETMKKLQKQITAAENEVFDYEALNDRSSYTDLPKLYKKLNDIWVKREELLKRSTNLGRILFKKFKYDSTPYPEINKCVEDLFNDFIKKLKNWDRKGYRDETFTFIDIHKAIMQVIKDKELDVRNADKLIGEVYEYLLQELRNRRIQESEDTFETLETLDDLTPETFVSTDPAIDVEIGKNKVYYERKMQELLQTYAKKDHEKNGECLVKEGMSEWDETLVDNEEFESIDIKEGELDEEDSDGKNDEECDSIANDGEDVIAKEHTPSTDDNCLRDLTNS